LDAGDALDPTTPWGPFQICLNDLDLTAIGGVGALYAPDDTGELELGYGIAESARGQGLASEAVVAFMNSLDGLGVSTVVAVIAPDNLPSQRLVERLGFTFDLLITTDQDGEMQRWTLPYRAVSI
jgi:RimJ/RimL family protein N-acetyltransferase